MRALLAPAVVRGGEQGNIHEINGIGISFGVGDSKDAADAVLRADKEDRAGADSGRPGEERPLPDIMEFLGEGAERGRVVKLTITLPER